MIQTVLINGRYKDPLGNLCQIPEEGVENWLTHGEDWDSLVDAVINLVESEYSFAGFDYDIGYSGGDILVAEARKSFEERGGSSPWFLVLTPVNSERFPNCLDSKYKLDSIDLGTIAPAHYEDDIGDDHA